MKATITAGVAAIEALAIALAGVAVIAVPGVLLWWLTFDLGAEPAQFASGVAAVWLLGHLVPLTVALTPESALGLGLNPEAVAFDISLVPLGITLLTAVLSFRGGWRFAGRGGAGAAGVLGGAVGFAAAAFGVGLLGASWIVWPVWAAVTVPALGFGVCAGAGFLLRAARLAHPWWSASVREVQRWVARVSSPFAAALPERLSELLRLALAAAAGFLALGGGALFIAIVVGYVEIVSLSQGLHLDLLGVLLVFLLQLAFLPVAILWSLAWLTGAGFAFGAGSSATPFDALLGPLPALPMLGAIPQGWGGWGALAPALVVLVGVGVGVLAARMPGLRRLPWAWASGLPLAAAALVGLGVAGACALAHGSVGPGRFAEVGPHPWLVGGLAAAELGAGMLLGVFATRVDRQRIAAALPVLGRESAEPRPTGSSVGADGLPSAGVTGLPPVGTAAGGALFGARADALAEQETVPIDSLPLAEQETVPVDPLPLDPLPGVTPTDGAPGGAEAEWGSASGEPSLEATPTREAPVPGMPPSTEAASAEAANVETSAQAAEANESEEEALLRAYAWDGNTDLDERIEQQPGGWRRFFPKR